MPARRAMQAIVEAGEVPELLAYDGGERDVSRGNISASISATPSSSPRRLRCSRDSGQWAAKEELLRV